VSFLAGDCRETLPPRPFDAIVGRLVFMYLTDPAQALRRLTDRLAPGGILAFQDYKLSPQSCRISPAVPLWGQAWQWVVDTAANAAIPAEVGFGLRRIFQHAGLPEPQMRLDSYVGGGPDSIAYTWMAESVRSMLPLIEHTGIATAEEIDIDTLADRLRDEAVAADAVAKSPESGQRVDADRITRTTRHRRQLMTTISPTPPVQDPPTMPGHPIIGSAWHLQRRLLATQERAMREIGDVVRFVAGPPGMRLTVYSAFAPDDVHRVLTARTGYRKDNRFYREVRAVFGDGLLTSQDDTWLRQKQFLQPLFVRTQMQRYGQIAAEEAAGLVERWKAAAISGEHLSLHQEMTQLTVRVIGRILFGADLGEMVPLVRWHLTRLSDDVRRRGFAPRSMPRSWPIPGNLRHRRALQELNGALDALIAERRADADPGRDMVGLLTRADSLVSDQEARDQLLVFLFAGHDTTATALTFALHLLGSHPHIQDKAADETRQVLDGRPPTGDDLTLLPYLGQILKEALRLYPPAYATSRRAVDGDTLSGYRVPPGTDLAVYPWCTHRHPRHWDHPARFDPDRFTPEREAARHRYAWFPFGGGPRACIGAQLSIVEATITLATVLQQYRLSTPAGPIPLLPRITLHPAAPVPCGISAR
jgi:cytochrome P450